MDQIKRFGADAVKLLAWFRTDADAAVLEHQEAFVADVGAACRRYDLPFVFELLVYPLARDGADVGPTDGAWRTEQVIASLEHFSSPIFEVDVFKVESPVTPAHLPAPELDDGSNRAAFEAVTRIVGRPWVLLSGGADRSGFVRALEYAYDAGASGYLAGRSIWWDAVSEFPRLADVRRVLGSDAVPFIREVNELTADRARPWWTNTRQDRVAPNDVDRDEHHADHRRYATIDRADVAEQVGVS